MIVRNLLIVIICLPVSYLFAQEHFSGAELEVSNIIRDLPEVKAKNRVYDSITKRVQEVKMRITPPIAGNNLYKVEVGYQGTGRFEPHYYFFVDPDTKLVYIEDMQKGDRPTLSEWRKRRKGPYGTADSAMKMEGADGRSKPVNIYPESP